MIVAATSGKAAKHIRVDANGKVLLGDANALIGKVTIHQGGDDVLVSAGGDLFTADLHTQAIKNAVEIMDDWDDTDRCKVIPTDGTNEMPMMDAVARPGFMKLTDGTEVANVNASNQLEVSVENAVTVSATDLDIRNLTPATDTVKIGDGTETLSITAEGILPIVVQPTRVTSDLGAENVEFSHGTVTADWSEDTSTAKSQSATYNFYITEIIIRVEPDLTTEIAIQPIPFSILVRDTTDNQSRVTVYGSLPNNAFFSFRTPIKIAKGHNYHTRIRLGGATNAILFVILNGFESED